MGDMRFDRYILLADNSPGALDWPRLHREWRRLDSLPVQDNGASGWRYARAHHLQRVCVPSRNIRTRSSSSNKQVKKQAAAARSSCKTSPADTAHCVVAPCRRLTQTDLASFSFLLRISTTTIRPAANSQLHRNAKGSTVNTVSRRRRSGASRRGLH